MSLPVHVDLEALINGDSAVIILDIVDSADEITPYPLTGWLFQLTAKHSKFQEDKDAILSKAILTENSSRVMFILTPEDTNDLVQAAYDYDIQISNAEVVATPFIGKLRIKRGVTEDIPQ